MNDFTDGIYFIELSSITNPDMFAATVGQPLGVRESGSTPIFESLKDYLRDKVILLVLDNFEQITKAAPQIAKLLSTARGLKFLVTSRICLRLSMEREFSVPPLTIPSTTEASLTELADCESVKLFIDRSRRARETFELTDENAKTVAEICRRLDGLPLAIELAAARIKILPPQAILTKLKHRLRLLIGGAIDLPLRQRTMRCLT